MEELETAAEEGRTQVAEGKAMVEHLNRSIESLQAEVANGGDGMREVVPDAGGDPALAVPVVDGSKLAADPLREDPLREDPPPSSASQGQELHTKMRELSDLTKQLIPLFANHVVSSASTMVASAARFVTRKLHEVQEHVARHQYAYAVSAIITTGGIAMLFSGFLPAAAGQLFRNTASNIGAHPAGNMFIPAHISTTTTQSALISQPLKLVTGWLKFIWSRMSAHFLALLGIGVGTAAVVVAYKMIPVLQEKRDEAQRATERAAARVRDLRRGRDRLAEEQARMQGERRPNQETLQDIQPTLQKVDRLNADDRIHDAKVNELLARTQALLPSSEQDPPTQ